MNLIKQVLNYTYKPSVKYYLRKERDYNYKGIHIKVFPGVFHPGLFYSTKILLEYLKQFDIKNKSFLELGAGSGLISLYASTNKAVVTASDISNTAINNIIFNAKLNNLELKTITSDLFDKISVKAFDYIIINPPYYRGKPEFEESFAWYAGEELDYFKKLFSTIGSYIASKTNAFMILSDACEINTIQNLANENGLRLIKVFSKSNLIETNTIWKMTS